MPQSDLDLDFNGVVYTLAEPTTDPLGRLRNRFTTQFLSLRNGPARRGSIFYTELNKGRVKTNADVITLFSLTAAEILTNLRRGQQDIAPTRAALDDFSFSADTIRLTFTIFSREGSVTETIEVGT